MYVPACLHLLTQNNWLDHLSFQGIGNQVFVGGGAAFFDRNVQESIALINWKVTGLTYTVGLRGE